MVWQGGAWFVLTCRGSRVTFATLMFARNGGRHMAKAKKKTSVSKQSPIPEYSSVLSDIAELLETARRSSARSVNAIMTATYWEIGRRIVEFEQGGEARAEYGEAMLKRLADDLTQSFGRGFSERNLQYMRRFYREWPISQTLSAKSEIRQTLSAKFQNTRHRLANLKIRFTRLVFPPVLGLEKPRSTPPPTARWSATAQPTFPARRR